MQALTGYPNTTGSHPTVVARDRTSPTATDGTPLLKRFMDEVMGVLQAALNGAQITPSGTAESASASPGSIESSQVLQAIQQMFMPAGIVVPLASDTVPTGARLLKCEGQGIVAANYPRLVTATWCGSTYNATASGFFRAANSNGSSRSNTGTYLILPDYRGAFLRGLDAGDLFDPIGSTKKYFAPSPWKIPEHGHRGVFTSTAEGGNEMKRKLTPEGTGANVEALLTAGDTRIYTGNVDTSGTLSPGSVAGASVRDLAPYHWPITWCITY